MEQSVLQPQNVEVQDKDQQTQDLLQESPALHTTTDEIIQIARKELTRQQKYLIWKEQELARLRRAQGRWKRGLLGICLVLVLTVIGFSIAVFLGDRPGQGHLVRLRRQREERQAQLDRLLLDLLRALYTDIEALEVRYVQRAPETPIQPVRGQWQSYPQKTSELVWRVLGNGSVEFKGKGIPLEVSLPAQVWAKFGPIVQEVSTTYGVPVPVMVATIAAESNGKPRAISTKGAQGLMQLMPNTAATVSQHPKLAGALHALLLPEHNLTLGGKYIASFQREHQWDPVKIALMYNMGIGRLKTDQLFNETREYLQRWVKYYNGAIAVTGKPGIPVGQT